LDKGSWLKNVTTNLLKTAGKIPKINIGITLTKTT